MRALLWGLLLISVGIVGCAPDIRTECEEQVQCRGGNDKDVEACVAVGDVVYDFLDDIGCDDEYDAYFECSAPLTTCRSMPTGQACMTSADCGNDRTCTNGECVAKSYGIDADDQDKCKAEKAAYGNCLNF